MEVVVHHSSTAYGFEKLLDTLPTTKGKHYGSHSTYIETKSSQEKEVTGDPVKLTEYHPYVLSSFRNLYTYQFLDCPTIYPFIIEIRNVIQAVKKRHHLAILFTFTEFFRTPMEVSYMWLCIYYDLSVYAE
jgi:hypothetical protein